MAFAFRWLLRIFSGLVVLLALALVTGYWFASRSLPDYDRTLKVAGVSAPVEIVRNNANVPHIFAETDADVFFGLGFAHAQDRLWQMTMLRRTAQGRLSEIFGQRTVRIDELLRRLDLYNLSVQSVRAQDPQTLAALEAYAAGVNAWLAEVNEGALGRGAPEMFLFSNQLAPWQPADSIAVIKLMALQLAGHLEEEVLRARSSLILPNERLQDILPDSPGAGIAAMPEYAELFPTVPRYTAGLDLPHDPLMPAQPRGFAGASNAWAAAPSRSAAGGTLLANDPHLGFSAPTIWYLARLELQSGGVIGGTIPGMPVVLAGRSEGFAWGITSSYLDDQDVYIEQLNPDDPSQVLTPEGYAPMTSRSSIITVNDADPVTVQLQWTQNGPVLPRHLFDLGTITPPGHVTSLAWTALSPADTSLSAALALMQAKTVEEGLAAGEGFIAPSQNLTMIDGENIALKTIGAMPKRDARHQTQGRIPTPGWETVNRWQGRMNYSSNPEFVAPAGGILGNTNNKTVERPFPLHVSHHYGDTQRVQRWRFLMQNREVHTRESFIEAQLDEVSPTARALLPLVAADLWFTGESAPEGTPARRRQEALLLLAEWNGEMNEHRPEPLIYSAWMRALQDRLIRDELGPLAQEYTHVEPLFIERVYRDIFGASAWCDVLQSAPTETCTDIARLALDDALVWIDEAHGGTLESLRWGDAHEATHDHQVLGTVPVLNWVVNIRQSTSGGDNTLLRGRTLGSGAEPFLNVHGAGYRGVYDLADPDSSVFITSTGQSGHPLSRHYDDLGVLWRRGEYILMSLDPALARAASVGITTLAPEN
ncbi:Penicillin amidase family protein [Candidatus Rhodobacter oscarellae]|uniref:Penicillin amidase family protein n=1 Tax=Candidatus Rhodobacter oscarellae TaxID=1675527 RepID=A0A0J9E6H0_9RHOB|nr:penicillin acylase family protein [Candidatus Rhodobacter lobularis]KMW57424.1 Penicillin amidase family protein [Candidatus Rhodobacter lobularis]